VKKGHRESHCKNGHPFTPANTGTKSRGQRGGTFRYCKACARTKRLAWADYIKDYHLQRKYGLTQRERSELLISQDGLCAICYERPAVSVDHDHETGRVRGMLCQGCNVALGILGDDEESIRRVLDYLTTPRLMEVV